jgi:KDO2-lipid IV(A) lauroyltransferase
MFEAMIPKNSARSSGDAPPSQRHPLWKRLRFRLELVGCRTLVRLLSPLSFKSLNTLAMLVGEVAWRVDSSGRRYAEQNIRLVFTECGPCQRNLILRQCYVNFARTMLSLFWSASRDIPQVNRITEMIGFDNVASWSRSSGKPLVLTTFHFGNWELSSLAVAASGLPTMIVGEDFKNPLLRPFFHGLRSRFGNQVVPQVGAAVRLLKHLKSGGSVAFLFDLTMPPGPNGSIVSAFGKPRFELSVTPLHVILARRTGALWVPVISLPDGVNGVKVIALDPIEVASSESINDAVQRGWDVLEDVVNRNPDLYLWIYRHFRYRPAQATREYPAYAQIHPPFETLRQEIKSGATPTRS